MPPVSETFSADYREARGKFLDACAIVGATLEHYAHPVPGPDGGDLSTDVALLGPPDAPAALTLCPLVSVSQKDTVALPVPLMSMEPISPPTLSSPTTSP